MFLRVCDHGTFTAATYKNPHHHLAPLGLASVDHSAAFKLWFLWFLLWQVILKNYIPSSLYTMLRGFGSYWKHGLADGGSVPVCATLVCFRGRGSRYSCQAHTASSSLAFSGVSGSLSTPCYGHQRGRKDLFRKATQGSHPRPLKAFSRLDETFQYQERHQLYSKSMI